MANSNVLSPKKRGKAVAKLESDRLYNLGKYMYQLTIRISQHMQLFCYVLKLYNSGVNQICLIYNLGSLRMKKLIVFVLGVMGAV